MDTLVATYNKMTTPIVRGVVHVYDKTHWFTDKEAWMLYRMFAIGEAVGWTLLIGAVTYRAFDMPGYAIAVSIAGMMHGLLFSLYFLFVFITARSMGWGFWRVSGALLAGIPPYTGLVFEQVMAYDRKKRPVYIAPPDNID